MTSPLDWEVQGLKVSIFNMAVCQIKESWVGSEVRNSLSHIRKLSSCHPPQLQLRLVKTPEGVQPESRGWKKEDCHLGDDIKS